MKLEKKYDQNNGEYYCDLTRRLDELCGYTVTNPRYKHYICDMRDLWDNCFVIRIPGRTTGNIVVDKNNVITKVVYYTKSETLNLSNIHKELERYIGMALEM